MKNLVLIFAVVAVASRARGQTASSSPFGDTARVRVITGSDLEATPKLLTYPHYPDRARSSNQEARVLVAFVLDSTGRPLAPSVRLLSAPSSLFDHSVCAWLGDAKFRPDLAHAAPALIVMALEFTLSHDNRPPDEVEHLGARPDLADLRGQLAALPRHELFERLANERHCE